LATANQPVLSKLAARRFEPGIICRQDFWWEDWHVTAMYSRISRRPNVFPKIFHILILALFVSAICGVGGAYSQTENSCRDVLFSPAFVNIISRAQDRSPGELASDRAGRALIGLSCAVEVLEEYFQSAGWEFQQKYTNSGEQRYGPDPGYRFTEMYYFCEKSRTVFTLFARKCVQSARVYFYEGRISNIDAGAVK